MKIMALLIGAASALTIATLNLLLWQTPWLGLPAGSVWLIGLALLAGSVFLRREHWIMRISMGVIILSMCVILLGSSLFYLARITDFSLALMVLLFPTIFAWIDWHRDESMIKRLLTRENKNPEPKKIKFYFHQFIAWGKTNWQPTVLILVYGALFTIALSTILGHRTAEAIRSPWEVLPRTLLILYFAMTLTALLLTRFLRHSWTLIFSLHVFLASSLALLVYAVGYGFDPFVHRATEFILSDTGTVTPKPYLYIGQYALVVFFSKLLSLPIPSVDILLLPVLVSILIPATAIISLQRSYHHHLRVYTLAAFSLLLLPSYFIVTIPQPLAHLFYLLLILLSFPFLSGNFYPLPLLWGMGASAFFIHPLTGIPALMYCALLTLLSRPSLRFRRTLAVAITLIGAVTLPALVAIDAVLHGKGAFAEARAIPFPDLLPSYLPFLSVLHTAELWHRALPALFFLGAIFGTHLLWKQGRKGLTVVPWLTALSLGVSYFIIRRVPLNAIIIYERAEFTTRILELIGITLLPFFLYSLLIFLQRGLTIGEPSAILPWRDEAEPRHGGAGRMTRVLQSDKPSVPQERHAARLLIPFSLLSFLITIAFYYSYPRVDAFTKSRGYSVSQSDIETVRRIEEDAKNEPFIVLSNQSVSAAALQEFGFKQYFTSKNCPLTTNHCLLFYYPIPTSSPLYQYYLDMVYQDASRETVERAMALTGVHRAYFVLNDYWLDAKKISERARKDADYQMELDKVAVFAYIKNNTRAP